ncbi:MAG: gephyrin-like molybdotransferase Glp [Haloferacaceae archaeon]
MADDARREAGFRDRTRVADARATLLDHATPHDRADLLPVARTDGRALAEPVAAARDVPGYDRAAVDGWAVRAEDTFGASDRAPETLAVAGDGDPEAAESVDPGSAARVHTGSPLPDGADAVVMVEHAERVGDRVDLFRALGRGENVGVRGEDVESGQHLFDAGHRLRPSDLGLLSAAGRAVVPVAARPTVGVVPTGEELVRADPEPGEVVETNALTVASLVSRWGGQPTRRDPVPDQRSALRAAIQRDLHRDIVVTTGGTSVGERDLVPEVIDDLGDLLVHGVALAPGHPVAFGVVEETPVLALPGYPVACVVNAVQFLRPALKRIGGLPCPDLPTVPATLDRKATSEPGVRTFVRVRLEARETDAEDGAHRAVPVRAGGSGVLSSISLADGWLVVAEDSEGVPAGERVDVELWEFLA